jgi:glycine cleavage system regulatory protein
VQVDAVDRAHVTEALAKSLDANHVPILDVRCAAGLQLSWKARFFELHDNASTAGLTRLITL